MVVSSRGLVACTGRHWGKNSGAAGSSCRGRSVGWSLSLWREGTGNSEGDKTMELIGQRCSPNSGLTVDFLCFASGIWTVGSALALCVGGAGTATTELVGCLPTPQGWARSHHLLSMSASLVGRTMWLSLRGQLLWHLPSRCQERQRTLFEVV